MPFESGVSGYVWGTYTVRVPFPVSLKGNVDISCNQCPYFRRTYRTCALNDSMCAFPEKYVGQNCPLELEEDDRVNKPKNYEEE